jgi:hypothetical protein
MLVPPSLHKRGGLMGKGLYRKYSRFWGQKHRNKWEGRTDAKLIRNAPIDEEETIIDNPNPPKEKRIINASILS